MSIDKRLAKLERGKPALFVRFESKFMRELCIKEGTDPDRYPAPWLAWSDEKIMSELQKAVMGAANDHN